MPLRHQSVKRDTYDSRRRDGLEFSFSPDLRELVDLRREIKGYGIPREVLLCEEDEVRGDQDDLDGGAGKKLGWRTSGFVPGRRLCTKLPGCVEKSTERTYEGLGTECGQPAVVGRMGKRGRWREYEGGRDWAFL